MDGFTEKKWFVYLGDHHEGPFSLEEIQAKMNQGQLSSTHFVWAEGMSDWKMMSEVQAFESILLPVAPPAPMQAAQVMTTSGPELSPVLSAAGPASGFMAVPIETTIETATQAPILEPVAPALFSEREITQAEMQSPQIEATEETPESLETMDPADHKKALAMQMAKIGALLLLLSGIGIAYNEGYLNTLLNSQSLKSATGSLSGVAEPVLTSLGFSPIPKLDDVDVDEYEQLKGAAKSKLDQAGAVFSMTMSKTDPLNPTFYLASNLPDGAIFDLYIEGIPDSLLNQLSFTAKTQVTIGKKFGKSSPIQFQPGAQGFVRGEYMVYVVDPETQPGNVRSLLEKLPAVTSSVPPTSVPHGLRVLAAKTYFLGGVKDATYTSRLQEYHAKIQAKAQQELSELKQITATYDSQLADTNQKFANFKKGRKLTPAQKKGWETFHGHWSDLNTQLSQTFAKLTVDAIQANYFYGSMYRMAQQAGEKLVALHALQSTYFTGPIADAKAFEIQLGEANAIAHSSIEELKTKITQIESTPPTPNGLPKREGI